MREGVENLPAETERYGLRYHGPVVAGVVTMPSGRTAGSMPALWNTIAVSGKPGPYGPVSFDQPTDVYLKNYAIVSYDDITYSTYLAGKNLGREAVPFVAPSGRVWLLSADAFWQCSSASFAGTAQRFGLFGKSATPDTHTVTINNPVSADTDLSGCVLRLTDATRDGSKRIYRAAAGEMALAWLELTITEVSATQISASFSVVKSYAQTKGSFSSVQAVFGPEWQNTWAHTGGVDRSPSVPFALQANTTYTYTSFINQGTPPATMTGAISSHVRATGHVFNMDYDDGGSLVETMMTIEASENRSFGAPSLSLAAAGSLTVTTDNNFPPQVATSSGSITFSGSSSSSGSCKTEVSVTVTRGGQPVASIKNEVVGTFVHNATTETVVTGAASGSTLPLHVKTTNATADTTSFQFSSEGQTKHTTSRSTGGPSVVEADANDATAGIGALFIAPSSGVTPHAAQTPNYDTLFAQVYVTAAVSGENAWLISRLRRRTNTIYSLPTALRVIDGTLTETALSGWDSSLVGRAGVLDHSQPAVAVAYGGGQISWDLPTVTEQPITGEWFRGASATQDVGFV